MLILTNINLIMSYVTNKFQQKREYMIIPIIPIGVIKN